MTTTWFSAKDRAIHDDDIGNLILLRDHFGVQRLGEVCKDNYGLFIQPLFPPGPPIARGLADIYTLFSKPPEW